MPQQELAFDDQPDWNHRLVGETFEAFRAFSIYRDLGLDRSIFAAYRRVRSAQAKARGEETGELALDTERRQWRTPAAWLRWQKEYCWQARVDAYDREETRKNAVHLELLRRERMEALFNYDRERLLPQLVACDNKIDELLAAPALAKTVTPSPDGKSQNAYDRVEVFKELTAERRRLVREYYGPTLMQLAAGARVAAAAEDGKPAPTPQVGRFEYVADDEVPAEPAPAPAPAAEAAAPE